MPDDNTAASRSDGGAETSVNWEDDDTVLPDTQRHSNAAHGVARVQLSEIRRINNAPNTRDALLAERTAGDPHHGNIVYRRDLAKLHRKMIATALALDCTFIAPPPGMNQSDGGGIGSGRPGGTGRSGSTPAA